MRRFLIPVLACHVWSNVVARLPSAAAFTVHVANSLPSGATANERSQLGAKYVERFSVSVPTFQKWTSFPDSDTISSSLLLSGITASTRLLSGLFQSCDK